MIYYYFLNNNFIINFYISNYREAYFNIFCLNNFGIKRFTSFFSSNNNLISCLIGQFF